jgi:hypothetical protein
LPVKLPLGLYPPPGIDQRSHGRCQTHTGDVIASGDDAFPGLGGRALETGVEQRGRGRRLGVPIAPDQAALRHDGDHVPLVGARDRQSVVAK